MEHEQHGYNPHVILRREEVQRRIGLSRSRLYARIAMGDFPAPVRLGAGRAVGWLESDIQAWLDKQIRASKAGLPTDFKELAERAERVMLEFRHAMLEAGFVPPDSLIADGELHRFSEMEVDGPAECWYALRVSADRASGTFGNLITSSAHQWREGGSKIWKSVKRHETELKYGE